MTDRMTIRELHGLDEIMTALPLLRQSSPARTEEAFRTRLSAMLAQGGYRCIAAYLDGRMVGVSGFWVGTYLWSGKYIEPDHLFVDPAIRSRGIGARMMAWMEAEGERLGCDVIKIAMILGRERTHEFYARNGYFDDGLLMVKALSRGAAEFPEYVAQPG